MASVRSLDNALSLEWPDGSINPITKNDGSTMIPNAGRVMRNLIHGADTVMSHITHFYALAALDYVDASILGPNWDPTYPGATPGLLDGVATIMRNGDSVAGNYVESLTMRRKMHTASAILSGRHPHSNAIVPGGVTTVLSGCDLNAFSNLLDQVRNFINTAYIPDVLTVAITLTDYQAFWSLGTSPGNLLSYGDFPIQTGTNPEKLLLARGLATAVGAVAHTAGPTDFLANVKEYVGYSYYDAGFGNINDGLHPSVGVTKPDVNKVGTDTSPSTYYSWLKAPRYDLAGTDLVCEVGPLARVHNTVYRAGGDTETVSEVKGTLTTDPAVTVQPCAPLGISGPYTLSNIATTAISLIPLGGIVSYLGRHACRALECKYLADAMSSAAAGTQHWLTELNGYGPTAPPYVYAKLPKKIALGAGWAEAPRGALGHWITIDKKRVASYQCVVPTTWNHGPRDTAGNQGPAESALMGLAIGTDAESQVLNTIRGLHTYDFCIACAVHLVRPDGSTIAKVKLDTDGKVTRLPNDAEI